MRARLHDGQVSLPQDVEVALTGTTRADMQLEIRDPGGLSTSHALESIDIEDRMGSAPRIVLLPGAASLEIVDNDAFDAALGQLGLAWHDRTMRWLEKRWAVALGALAATAVATWAFVNFGVPALAARAVVLVPPAAERQMEVGGLALLDEHLFRPTKLAPHRQSALRTDVARIRATLQVSQPISLEFRAGGALGPNAFALPAGTIVITDELVQLARHDDELRAVFAHEIGHITGRHAMRMLLQNSATALLAVGLLGDVSAVSSMTAAVPAVIVQARYSRAFEREADAEAYRWMQLANVPHSRMRDLLLRVESTAGVDSDWGFLSTHPPSSER